MIFKILRISSLIIICIIIYFIIASYQILDPWNQSNEIKRLRSPDGIADAVVLQTLKGLDNDHFYGVYIVPKEDTVDYNSHQTYCICTEMGSNFDISWKNSTTVQVNSDNTTILKNRITPIISKPEYTVNIIFNNTSMASDKANKNNSTRD